MSGTVHVAVVDPGVGTSRDIVAVEAHGHVFLAPDNGLLAPIVILLPLSALYHKDTATAAWVLDPKTSKLVLKPVQVLRYTDAGVVIGAGLAPGDVVVLKGVAGHAAGRDH